MIYNSLFLNPKTGDPLTADAWDAIMDAAYTWAVYDGSCNKTENRIDISFSTYPLTGAPVQIIMTQNFDGLFAEIQKHAKQIANVHLPYLSYSPADGQPTQREAFIGLFSEKYVSYYDNNYNQFEYLLAMCFSNDEDARRIELTDGAGNKYIIVYKVLY